MFGKNYSVTQIAQQNTCFEGVHLHRTSKQIFFSPFGQLRTSSGGGDPADVTL